MDYSQLSDFEINCEVLAVFEPDVNHMCLSESKEYFYDCGPVGDGWHQIDIPDYCNNPADAWPIITEAKISLLSVDCIDGSSSWLAKSKACPSRGDSNPLRAAMIVFLMMQDAKHA